MSSTVSTRFNSFDVPTRAFILTILADLVRGHDVNVVAVPYELAVDICRAVVSLARPLGIDCNGKSRDESALTTTPPPAVRPRAYDRQIPLPTPKTKVHIHYSASFERQSARPPAHRSIIL